ncbi:MAG: hypothetical protein EA351_14145 [Gemmatimonadales bacterium]|nr:MAG: hypothetical protein EA351_14145 [Gemmatimonadales bacterium]
MKGIEGWGSAPFGVGPGPLVHTTRTRRIERRKERIMRNCKEVAILLLWVPMLAGCEGSPLSADDVMPVQGSVVHYLSTAVVHSEEPTENGLIQRSTEIVELSGDLEGYLLYHPTTTFDFANQTMVNTGTQVFSGTVGGSDPVILHDDRFRFDVDLETGETIGTVHLSRSHDAPQDGWYECDLEVVGTGMTPEGDALADYSGECRSRGGSD